MAHDATAIKGRFLLVAAPWPLFNRPSLPLGALKAYLISRLPNLEVATSHFFLHMAHNLGYERYHNISRRVWRAEAVFSALLYPDRIDRARSLYRSTFKRNSKAADGFQKLVVKVKTIADHWMTLTEWSKLDLIGFSISFCQVTASLYLISRVKAVRPNLPVIVGGSSFSTRRIADVLAAFPLIDYLITGEGEQPLTELICQLLSVSPLKMKSPLPDGVHTALDNVSSVRFYQLSRLDPLPVPDYKDYFDLLEAFPPAERFFPTLPVEASRGCWWHGMDTEGQYRGCAFCNLNLQWEGYRIKPAPRVIAEVDQLTGRHQTLSVAFNDNTISPKHASAVFEGLRRLKKDLSIFAELRADSPGSLIKQMRQAGVDTVQVGIEALSSRLLKKMNKGVRAIDNLCMMKQCEAAGIVNASNLMLHFPSSDADDVGETLQAMKFARWYRPLKTVNFWLGAESPVQRNPRRFNIRTVFNHPNLKKLFPDHVAAAFCFLVQDYRGDRQRQLRLWRPVKKAVQRWQKDYDSLMIQTQGRPALTYGDGGRFLIIDQHMPGQSTVRHRLTGVSADIYRTCAVPQGIDDLTGLFSAHSRQQIHQFCRTMVDKALMFGEGDCYLSLASPSTWMEGS